jgi:hypothetical protein
LDGDHTPIDSGGDNNSHASPGRIDKSVLAISEPRRHRDKAHLKFVGSQACLVCGREPSDAHHLRFAQPRALGRKVSDEYTVPLCRSHHREVHQTGNEPDWWAKYKLVPLPVAGALWRETHPVRPGVQRKDVTDVDETAGLSVVIDQTSIVSPPKGPRNDKTKPINPSAAQ